MALDVMMLWTCKVGNLIVILETTWPGNEAIIIVDVLIEAINQ